MLNSVRSFALTESNVDSVSLFNADTKRQYALQCAQFINKMCDLRLKDTELQSFAQSLKNSQINDILEFKESETKYILKELNLNINQCKKSAEILDRLINLVKDKSQQSGKKEDAYNYAYLSKKTHYEEFSKLCHHFKTTYTASYKLNQQEK